MKLVIGLMMCCFAFSSFADSVKETVESIELERNVKCDFVKKSIALCLGIPVTYEPDVCRYSITYSCVGAEAFKLKVKVKDFYNHRTNSRESTVIGTTIRPIKS